MKSTGPTCKKSFQHAPSRKNAQYCSRACVNPPWRPFEQAREYVRSLSFRSNIEWREFATSPKRPTDIPTHPDRTYKKQWVNWGDWLGTGNVCSGSIEYLSFEEGRNFARSLGLTLDKEWRAYSKSGRKPDNIPADPAAVYKDHFLGMPDWLGSTRAGRRWILPFTKAREFVRGLGLSCVKNWSTYCKSGKKPANIPTNPAAVYGAEFLGMPDWLGKEAKQPFLPFKEARAVVRRLGLTNNKDWLSYLRSGERSANIPADPAKVYASDFLGLADWLGSNNLRNGYFAPGLKIEYRPFKEAQALVQTLGLQSRTEWNAYCQSGARPIDIPAKPERAYPREFEGYHNWLGKEKKPTFLSFEDARAFVRSLGLRNYKEWCGYVRSRPVNIPANPRSAYKGQFRGWGDFLGTGNISNREKHRNQLPFDKARQRARTLNLGSCAEWYSQWRGLHLDRERIPIAPDSAYEEWVSWDDWLGTGNVATQRQSIERARAFARSLLGHLDSLSQAELYRLAEASGAFLAKNAGGRIVKAIVNGRLPTPIIEAFASGEDIASEVVDSDQDSELSPDDAILTESQCAEVGSDADEPSEDRLPNASPEGLLLALGKAVSLCPDQETIDFLVAKKEHQFWQEVMRPANEASFIAGLRAFKATDEYVRTCRSTFLAKYDATNVESLVSPQGYQFRPTGSRRVVPPNLMQRLVAVLVKTQRRVGNWSGTGRGKTNSAILASRHVKAKLTVVFCPNSVIETWERAILRMFPDSDVQTKTFAPKWNRSKKHHYLILNYDLIQQAHSAEQVGDLVESQNIDLVVIDEVQAVKQRGEDISKRRKVLLSLLAQAEEKNPKLSVLGMSATPIINNLNEGKALIELISGKAHADLGTTATVVNCMRMHARLTSLGPRWITPSSAKLSEVLIDNSASLPDLWTWNRRKASKNSVLELEEILTKDRLPVIVKHLEPKTIVYSHYIGGEERIDGQLRDAIEAAGYTVGFFTGESKVDLVKDFVEGSLDVLVVSSAIALGVDRLQEVSRKLIFNVLPWTAAEFDQIVARVDRQGQRQDVEVVLPITVCTANGKEWSSDRRKQSLIKYKRSVADAAVDGVVWDEHFRSPEQAMKDLRDWLGRLERGELWEDTQKPALLPPPLDVRQTESRRRGGLSELSRLNSAWAKAPSTKTHVRLQKNPEEWHQYHALRVQAEASWDYVPRKEFVKWAKERGKGRVIGDFGCGLAQVREDLLGRHKVHSFDHVAANEHVQACDMRQVPLKDGQLDDALFSLSLQGSNFVEYLYEAHRCLRLDGGLHIYEPLSWFEEGDEEGDLERNVDGFKNGLKALGFGHFEHVVKGRFVEIRGLKTRKTARKGVRISFNVSESAAA